MDKWLVEMFSEPDLESGKQAARFLLFVNLFDGGPVLLITLICFIIYVHMRGLQIQRRTKEQTRLEHWSNSLTMVPYHYQIPRAKLDHETASPASSSGLGVSVPLPAPYFKHVPMGSMVNSTLDRNRYYDNRGYEPANQNRIKF